MAMCSALEKITIKIGIDRRMFSIYRDARDERDMIVIRFSFRNITIKVRYYRYIIDRYRSIVYIFQRILFNSERDNLSHPIFFFFFSKNGDTFITYIYLYHRILVKHC